MDSSYFLYYLHVEICTFSIFIGLVGLTLLEYSLTNKRFANYVLEKNFTQFSICIIVYWLVGYAFSYGDNTSKFIGETLFAGDKWNGDDNDYYYDYYSFRGLIYSNLVLSGIFIVYIINIALIEKVSYITYMVFPFFVMIWIWPVSFSWSFGYGGWLNTQFDKNIIDLGGSIRTFAFAGGCCLPALLFTGINRQVDFKVESCQTYILGSFLTIYGIFGLAASFQTSYGTICFSNLWISGAVCSLVSLKLLTIYDTSLTKHYIAVYQGFMAGMVGASSSAENSETWIIAVHSIITAFFFSAAVWLLKKLKIDDRGNVLATYLLPGIFGGVLPGFIDKDLGVFFYHSGGDTALKTNVIGTIVVTLWAVFWTAILFAILACLKVLKLNIANVVGDVEITQRGYKEVERNTPDSRSRSHSDSDSDKYYK